MEISTGDAGRAMVGAFALRDPSSVLHDPDDRAVLCGEAFLKLCLPLGDSLRPGSSFAAFLQAGLDRGWFLDIERPAHWIEERLRKRRKRNTRPWDVRTRSGWLRFREHHDPGCGVVTTVSDITDLMGTIKQQTGEIGRWKDFVETASDWFWEMDAEFRFTKLFDAYDAISPVDLHIIGKTRWEVAKIETPDEEVYWRQHIEDLEARRPFVGFRYRFPRPDGRTVQVWCSGRPFYGSKGSFLGYRGSARLEWEMPLHEGALTHEWSQLLDAFDRLPLAITFYDRSERLLFQNTTSRRIVGPYRPGTKFEAIMNRQLSLSGLQGKAHCEIGERVLERFRKGLGPVEAYLDGRWWQFHYYQTTHGTLAYRVDISEEKAVVRSQRQDQSNLARARRLVTMGEMAAAIAHQVNDPLNASSSYLAGTLNRIAVGTILTPEILEALEKTAAEIKRAGATIRDIREFLRRSRFEMDSIQINEVVAKCLDVLERDHDITRPVIERRLAEDLPVVLASSVEIEQVVLNIVRNALDAMEPRSAGRVVVSTLASSSHLEVRVADDGVGVSVEDPFQPFQSTKGEGTGLGLSIAKTIVEEHGGEIGFKSRPEGGSIFWFSLPRTLGDASGHE